jgi:superfamily II DNA/RNA helicase
MARNARYDGKDRQIAEEDFLRTDTFSALGVPPFFVERLESRGISGPTEIQKRVIPRIAGGKSLLFRSATGTGKTFAYLLPVLGRLMESSGSPGEGSRIGPRCLVCAPTYELCSQIKQEADFLLEGTKLKTALVIGSARMERQIDVLKKDRPAVTAGNPGRLLILARMGMLKFRDLEFLILDEGDRLVSDELLEETRELAGLIHREILPERNLPVITCSATFSTKSRERLVPLIGGTETEEAGGAEVLRNQVEHWAFFSEGRQKIDTLRSFLAAAGGGGKKTSFKVLIFTGRGGQVGNIVSRLQYHKLAAAGLWGDMDKNLRKRALDDFRAGRVRFLVTSDLAARGLDISGISHVVALDTSDDQDAYIHRAGRTARAGKKGVMVTIGDEKDLRRLSKIEKKLGIMVYPKELYGGRIGVPEPEERDISGNSGF